MNRVSVKRAGGVAVVRLNRPEKMNAVDFEMIDAVIAVAEDLAADPALRAVVLTGEGRAFCAGLDVANFSALALGDPEGLIMPRSHGAANRFQQFSLAWRALPVPVIAALHGVAFGAGLQLAAGADLRIAAPGTRLSIMEMKWGLVPDMGGMVTLPEILRADHLRRMTWTAEEVSAEEALQIGLVTEIAEDPLARAMALAQVIAGKSPSAIRAAKRLIEVACTAPEAEVLERESREQTDLIGKPDQMEVIAANMQGRAPRFD
ncbi:enoyl-CoA hydratase/carnithine racemase [Rhodobacter aestuarii]|uniref:Enoyl-CoA hydratase/carnithine racemase n=1 Tax=Rhodobacter aestuarii TaxID=453582 RepID=A0A1N7K307_9RHOB|nr:crotonase/enoyl-CoA hydratase family protein [Rhodobacter aestuarii]PTV95881.1 enoyl-CoA hydratase/carnithine racemase [Rhodobacter aestuarii]SIS55928.1 Enoyl-CoA hydratase/carnithine racemase [Rhodobacter aestuarii]